MEAEQRELAEAGLTGTRGEKDVTFEEGLDEEERRWVHIDEADARPISNIGRTPAAASIREKWRREAYRLFIKTKREVPGRLTTNDAKSINRDITASYAQMYLSQPAAFKWSGMAAFASASVGVGMRQAYELGFGEGMRYLGREFVWVGGLLLEGESVGIRLGKKPFWALTGGNRVVWWDIFWQHLAYREAGIDELIRANKAGELPRLVIEAWKDVDNGVRHGNTTLVRQGNEALLKYEQSAILQIQVYDKFSEIWPRISGQIPSPIPEHGINIADYVPNGNIGNFNDRWKWVEESMLPAWNSLEARKPEVVRARLSFLAARWAWELGESDTKGGEEFEAFDSEVDSGELPAASGLGEADTEDMWEGRATYDEYSRTDPEIENFQAGVDALFGAFVAGGESVFDEPVGENLLPDGLDLSASVLGWTKLLWLVPASVRRSVENKLLKACGEWLATNRPRRRRFPNEPRTNLDGLSIPPWVNAKAVFGHLTGQYDKQHAALTAADRTKKFSRAPAEILGANLNNPVAANYFVLHDTGSTQDHTHSSKNGGVHLWIGKVSLARGMDWDRAGDATKLEFGNQTCLIHVELTRATGHSINMAAPDTYPNAGISTARQAATRYTDQQYDDLANAYIVASIRRGRFLTITAHKEIDRSAARRGHPNQSAHGDPEDLDVERLYRLISRKLVLPADSTFGIGQQRINSRNLAGHVNDFIEYARGNAAAANQYAWPIPWQHQNPGLPQGDSTKPPYKSTGLYVMPLLNAANQPILNCGNGKWDQGPP